MVQVVLQQNLDLASTDWQGTFLLSQPTHFVGRLLLDVQNAMVLEGRPLVVELFAPT